MIVTLASAWSASKGGINAFNIELTRALARTYDRQLFCAVTEATAEEIRSASEEGITLIKVTDDGSGKPSPDCAQEMMHAIESEGAVRLWIGHDLISGEAAIKAATAYGGKLALIHHMDYLSYQNILGDRGDETYRNNDRQARMLRTEGATLFGVGSWLTDNATRLGGRTAHCLVPGFPSSSGSPGRNSSDRLLVASAGRFDEKAEPLKRVGTALDAFAMAISEGSQLRLLREAAMIIVGVDAPEDQRKLHARAAKLAGRPVNIVSAGFQDDPTAVARLASTSHLVIVPSRHEGFGLVGWEAIGTETPLIIGSNTGLADQLRRTLNGVEEDLVAIVDLDGTEQDSEKISKAILKVAANLPNALRRAGDLKVRLKAELDCSWSAAAKTMLEAVGLRETSGKSEASQANERETHFNDQVKNHYSRCVELAASAAQGSCRQSVELIVELRFGITKVKVDDITAEIALKKAMLEVKPKIGKIQMGERLGEGGRTVPGIEARSGGVWLIEPTEGDHLIRKVLGNESLCVVESSGEDPSVIDLEVTAAVEDMECMLLSGRKLNKNQQRIMGVFLKDCIYQPVSGEVVFSSATLSEKI